MIASNTVHIHIYENPIDKPPLHEIRNYQFIINTRIDKETNMILPTYSPTQVISISITITTHLCACPKVCSTRKLKRDFMLQAGEQVSTLHMHEINLSYSF